MRNKQNLEPAQKKKLQNQKLLYSRSIKTEQIQQTAQIQPNSYKIHYPNYSLLSGYSMSILKNLKQNQIRIDKLQQRLPYLALAVRTQQFNWLLSFKNILKLSEQTIFSTFMYYDIFLSKSVNLEEIDYHLLILGCLFIASKVNEIYQIRLSNLIRISRKQFTKQQILGIQGDILLKLNFQLSIPTIYQCYNSIKYIYQIQFQKIIQSYVLNLISCNLEVMQNYGTFLIALSIFYIISKRRCININIKSITSQNSEKFKSCVTKIRQILNQNWYRILSQQNSNNPESNSNKSIGQ